jgi:hypothetical protein
VFPADARTHIRDMTPKELKSLMARTRASSEMLGKALGISPVQVRKWRGGARPIPERHLDKIEAFFRERGAQPPETPRMVDPRDVPQAPVTHRFTITPRDDPLPPANGATLVEAINGLIAVLLRRRRTDPMLAPALAEAKVAAPTARPQPLSQFRRDDHDQPACPIAEPPAARTAQIIDAMPLGPPPEPFSVPKGPRCRWPHTDTPGASSGPCEQLAAPGLLYCALHWVQHVQQRQRFG